MRKIILLLMLFIPCLVGAKVPDENDIINQINNPESPYYYTGLWLKYNNQQTLTPEEYHYLYYGYAYQEDYKPMQNNPFMDRVLVMVSGLSPDKPLVEDVEALIGLTEKALEYDPFSPKLLNILAFCYGALGNTPQEKFYNDRTNGVVAAIEDSGSSLKQDSPQHVIMFDHAVDVMAVHDRLHLKPRVVSRKVEFIPLTVPIKLDGKKIKGYYFDFSRVYWNKPEGYTYERARTWQFNNLKPKTYK